MSDTVTNVLVFANRTATSRALLDHVRQRAAAGDVAFHLVVPAEPRGLQRLANPEDTGYEEAAARLEVALGLMSEAAGARVTGCVGEASPLDAITDAIHFGDFDEVIVSTLPRRVSRWLHLDLPSKVAALGLPVAHVVAGGAGDQAPQLAKTAA